MGKGNGGAGRAAQNNRANQMNPNNSAYHSSRQGSGSNASPLPDVSSGVPPRDGGETAGDGGVKNGSD